MAGAKITKAGLRGRARIAIRTARDGLPFFVLIAANGEPMASGETYARSGGALLGARTFKRLVAEAGIVDERERKPR